MITVLLVDDHQMVRSGLQMLLSGVPNVKVVGEADSGEQAVVIFRQLKPDIVVMDVKLPGIDGLEATRRLMRIDPDVKVIGLTSLDDEILTARFLQAGAAGYLTKDCSMEEMIIAIKKVNVGQRYISPTVAQKIALRQFSPQQSSPFDLLSDRELQIMRLIVKGDSVESIADKLCLSSKTINSHRYRIFKRLNINNDVQLTHVAIRYGMLDELIYAKFTTDKTES